MAADKPLDDVTNKDVSQDKESDSDSDIVFVAEVIRGPPQPPQPLPEVVCVGEIVRGPSQLSQPLPEVVCVGEVRRSQSAQRNLALTDKYEVDSESSYEDDLGKGIDLDVSTDSDVDFDTDESFSSNTDDERFVDRRSDSSSLTIDSKKEYLEVLESKLEKRQRVRKGKVAKKKAARRHAHRWTPGQCNCSQCESKKGRRHDKDGDDEKRGPGGSGRGSGARRVLIF